MVYIHFFFLRIRLVYVLVDVFQFSSRRCLANCTIEIKPQWGPEGGCWVIYNLRWALTWASFRRGNDYEGIYFLLSHHIMYLLSHQDLMINIYNNTLAVTPCTGFIVCTDRSRGDGPLSTDVYSTFLIYIQQQMCLCLLSSIMQVNHNSALTVQWRLTLAINCTWASVYSTIGQNKQTKLT